MLELEQYKYGLSEIWDAIEEIEVSFSPDIDTGEDIRTGAGDEPGRYLE